MRSRPIRRSSFPLLALGACVVAHTATAQERPLAGASARPEAPRHAIRVDAAAGLGPDWTTAALSAMHEIGVGSSRRWRIGYGGRLVTMAGRNVAFTTAPPALIRAGVADTIDAARPRVTALNLAVSLGWQPATRWRLGANIDVVGVGFGPGTDVVARGAFAPPLPSLRAAPSRTNLLQGGTRDRGSLASEFFVAYAVSPTVSLRAGLGHLVAELETTPPLPSGNSRHRRFLDVLFVGVTREWRMR